MPITRRRKRYTDRQLGGAGRTGPDRAAYLSRQRLAKPGGMAAAGARGRENVLASAARLNPWRQADRTPRTTAATAMRPEFLQGIVETGRGVPGSQYAGARGAGSLAPGGMVRKDILSPAGRYVGPGRAGAPDLATQARMYGTAEEPGIRTQVAQGRAGFLEAQARGKMAEMAPTIVEQQVAGQPRAQMIERLSQIAEAYPDPADKQRIAEVMERLITGQEIPPEWLQWLQWLESAHPGIAALTGIGGAIGRAVR